MPLAPTEAPPPRTEASPPRTKAPTPLTGAPTRTEVPQSTETPPPRIDPPRPQEGAAPPATAPPAVTPPAKPPALDLASLEQRLRDTSAIGIMTKLSLKNQVDDLLEQFRAFHGGRSQVQLATLREGFDLLLLKVLSLLQDRDPGLARDISASREALWNLLADPSKFANL
jgi:hypothetical protein